ncbi:MAG: MG2 domain-containing protein [Odoribacter splanchnicus]
MAPSTRSTDGIPLLPLKTIPTLITDRKDLPARQTVYYKGIGWKATLDTLYALEDRKYKISFKDANDKEIAQQEVTSNRYGSFTGSFVIPARILNGYFTLYTEKGQTTIEVADYKRPEFEILFHEPTRTYFAGDVVWLKGQVRSFSGVKMAHTDINYTISVSSPIVYFHT